MTSFLAVVGWLFICVIALYITGAWLVMVFNNTGQYNIGGVPNSRPVKVGTWLCGILVFLIWRWVISISPFVISIGNINNL